MRGAPIAPGNRTSWPEARALTWDPPGHPRPARPAPAPGEHGQPGSPAGGGASRRRLASSRRACVIVGLPAMNIDSLLCVLVDESAGDGRASPSMLRSDSGGDCAAAEPAEELVGLAGMTFRTVAGRRRPGISQGGV